jgi:hypothetical protein
MADLFGVDLILDPGDLAKLVLRLGLNLFFVGIVLRVYYRYHARRDFAFSCVMLNVITFAVCLLLRKVPVDMGFALGLFAVFGILRYRTEPIGARDLTYLFVLLGIGILNAVANKKISLAELVLINAAVVGIAAFLEHRPLGGRKETRLVVYDRLDLLRPGREDELLADLRTRLGIEATAFELKDVDLLRDTAKLLVTSSARLASSRAVPSTPPEPSPSLQLHHKSM